MSFLDALINSLIKYLQKKKHVRKKRKTLSRKLKTKTRKTSAVKSKKITNTKKSVKKKRPAKKVAKKAVKKSVKKTRPKATKKPSKSVARKSPSQKSKKVTSQKSNSKTKKVKKTEIEGAFIGPVTHYFSNISVIVLEIRGGILRVGDEVLIKGKTSKFVQTVDSMQVESVDVQSAKKGQLVGLKVKKKTRVGDLVFKTS